MFGEGKSGDTFTLRGARVLFVIGPFDLGGAERQALLFARHMAHEQGAHVEVWGMGKPGRVSELCDEYGITWRSVPIPLPWSESPRAQIKRLAKFAKVLRSARPDVILPYMFYLSVVCGMVWRFTGARVCIWNQRDEGRDRVWRWAEQVAVRSTPYFIANSQHGADFLVQQLGVKPDRLRIVYNGVQMAPPQRDRAAWRAELGLSDDTFAACMVANLQAFKDHVTLLKAWRIVLDRLKPEGREPVLLLAGGFHHTHLKLKVLAYDLDLGRSVRFLGAVKDISGLLGAVDLGIHSSVNEGVPNGVLECMASGLAVVGTDYSGIREAVGPEGYAFLAPPRDAETLAERIIAMARDPETRRAAGAANRLRIEEEFRPRNMFRNTVAVIAEALRGRELTPRVPPVGEVLAENHESH